MNSIIFFVENLTLRAWWLTVWPSLIWKRFRGETKVTQCYVIDGSRLAMFLAKASAWIPSATVNKLAFRLFDMRDENGLSLRFRIAYQDLAEVQELAIREPVFQELIRDQRLPDKLPTFLARRMAVVSHTQRLTMWRALLLVHVCNWKMAHGEDEGTPFLFLERRPWLTAVARYGSRYGVTIVPVPSSMDVRNELRHRLPPRTIALLRFLRYRVAHPILSLFTKKRIPLDLASTAARGVATATVKTPVASTHTGPRVAVDYRGQINLNQPELHSDLFFWQQSSLAAKDLLVFFPSKIELMNSGESGVLHEHGIAVVALKARASTVPVVPVSSPNRQNNRPRPGRLLVNRNGLESPWLRRQIADYHKLRASWTDRFVAHNVRVFVTWYKYDADHCAISDALRELGGINAIYQRAYESNPSAETTIATDIVFGFSPAVAEVERRSQSTIRYHVATGYLGDYRFRLLRANAQSVREYLQQQGATRIIAYFDENSAADARWHTGDQPVRENYAFMLEKLLAEPWMGLLIKPKAHKTLRRRLGPVAELLERAEATGRCYVYDRGYRQSSNSPAEAALAADIAIHGHLISGTAGVEAALVGVPTLLLDREGWKVSPLYKLGLGRVVFRDWDELWEACLHHWATPGGSSGIGDWSAMMDELDPFRDGRAAERMGTYIKWLIDGLRDGQVREAVMEDAAERYCALWGSDKITSVQSSPELWAPDSSLEGHPDRPAEGLHQYG